MNANELAKKILLRFRHSGISMLGISGIASGVRNDIWWRDLARTMGAIGALYMQHCIGELEKKNRFYWDKIRDSSRYAHYQKDYDKLSKQIKEWRKFAAEYRGGLDISKWTEGK